MSLPTVRDRQSGFAAGLNTTSDDAALSENECRAAVNAQLSTRGAIRKRQGTQRVSANALPAAVLGGYSWARTSSVQELVVADGSLYTGALSIPITWTDRGGSLSTTVYPSFAAFKGPSAEGVYIADGGQLNFWDGTALTEDIAGTPNVEAIAAWGPRLFAVKDDTIYWSSTTSGINGHTLGNAGAGGGSAIVRTYGGQSLVGLAPLRGSLLLFHRSAISRFTGATQDDIDIDAGTQGISGDVGTVAKRSIIAVENAVYFLSDRGVFSASESAVEPVSSPLEDTLANLTKNDWVKVSSVHARAFNEIRWAIPGAGVYVFNYRTRGWTGPWTAPSLAVAPLILTEGGDTLTAESGLALGLPAETGEPVAMWDTKDGDGRSVVLSGHENGHVLWNDRDSLYVDDLYSDSTNGRPYEFRVQCRRFFANDYTLIKSWRTLYVLGDFPDPSLVGVSVQTSGNGVTYPLPYDPSQFAGSYVWGGTNWVWGTPGVVYGDANTATVERARIPMQGTSPWADVTFTYTGGQSARLSIVDVEGFARRRR